MKNFITFILIFISSVLFGQNLDLLTFDYVNQYRVKNNKKVLVWSNDLYASSIKQSDNMVINDSIYHSHGYTYSENVGYGKNTSFSFDDGYKNFIKEYFNLSYDDVLKNINIYCVTDVVYRWSISNGHNKIMLSDKKYGAIHVILKDVIKKNNFVWNREVFLGCGKFYYVSTVAVTIQLN